MIAHRREDRPALRRLADHPPEGVGQRRRDQQDRHRFQEVRERRRVLERHRGVRVEEAAAVRAELLDRDLRGRRAHRQHLLRALDGRDLLVGAEVLDDALGHEQQRHDDRERQQDPENAASQVDPEIAEVRRASPHEPADQHDHDHDADRGGHEVLHRQRQHLRQVAQRRLAAVRLPVRIRREARRRVEREMRRRAGESLRVQRQVALRAQDPVDGEHAQRAEHQHADARSASSPSPPSRRRRARGRSRARPARRRASRGAPSPSNTAAMYAPSGFVSASTTAKYRRM